MNSFKNSTFTLDSRVICFRLQEKAEQKARKALEGRFGLAPKSKAGYKEKMTKQRMHAAAAGDSDESEEEELSDDEDQSEAEEQSDEDWEKTETPFGEALAALSESESEGFLDDES